MLLFITEFCMMHLDTSTSLIFIKFVKQLLLGADIKDVLVLASYNLIKATSTPPPPRSRLIIFILMVRGKYFFCTLLLK